MATGTLAENDKKRSILAEQMIAWTYYGLPDAKAKSKNPVVGEVRYVVGWMSDQMTRLQWRVKIDGSYSWTVDDIRSDEKVEDQEEPNSPINASGRLLSKVGWSKGVVRQVMTNLFVGGELHYLASDDDVWTVVSVVHPDRDKLIDDSAHEVHGLWPHPANPKLPDAPLFGVLPVLEELDWLSRLSRSQSAARVGMRGVMGVADGLSFANGGEFWEEWNATITSRMSDPLDVSPAILRGAAELIEPSGNGMKGLSWMIPNFPYDARIDDRIDKAINRLAYGLPIPPEILLGMQAQSRATAFQVEENSYRAHIEPPAWLVADIAQKALSLVLEGKEVLVEPEPSKLLARTHTVEDAKDAFDRGAVGFGYLRTALAIPEDAAPKVEELALILAIIGASVTPGARDPGGVAAGEAVTASVGGPHDDPLTPAQLDELSAALAAVDAALLMELGGATQQATERARERVGAKARTREGLRAQVPRTVPNDAVATHLGIQALSDDGVPISSTIDQALGGLLSWWSGRVTEAQSQVAEILGPDVAPDFHVGDVQTSADMLAAEMKTHVMETLESPAAYPLSAEVRQRVISVAGGADAGAIA